jgi:DNA-binding transcriptional MerR regulator
MFSTGELAKKANISRRALHYYDEIGLLKPTKINDKNYRYYDQHALVQLQEILLLKSIGFTLDQIKQFQYRSKHITYKENIVHSIQEQIDQVQNEKERLERKLYYLRTTLHTIQLKGGQVDPKDIFDLIQLLEDRKMENGVVPATFHDDYFTEEEKTILKQLPVVGSDNPTVTKMIELAEKIRKNLHLSPRSTHMQQIAKQIHELNLQMFQNDTSLAEKYWERIKPNKGQSPYVYGLDQTLMDYIDEMYTYFIQQQEHEQDER